MTDKAKIKVIKKNAQLAEVKPSVEKKSKQAAAREIVSNVSNWVNDFQHRRREETQQAIEKFFTQKPQTSGI